MAIAVRKTREMDREKRRRTRSDETDIAVFLLRMHATLTNRTCPIVVCQLLRSASLAAPLRLTKEVDKKMAPKGGLQYSLGINALRVLPRVELIQALPEPKSRFEIPDAYQHTNLSFLKQSGVGLYLLAPV